MLSRLKDLVVHKLFAPVPSYIVVKVSDDHEVRRDHRGVWIHVTNQELYQARMARLRTEAHANAFKEMLEEEIPSTSRSIKDWQKLSLEYAAAKGFDLAQTTDGDKLMLIVSEAAEALECVRNGEPDLHFDTKGKPEGLGPELADIMLRTIQYAAYKGIDLEEMMQIKNEYNLSRPAKHGGKAF